MTGVNRARDAEHAARAPLGDLRDAESLGATSDMVESEDDAAELTRIADVLAEAATAARTKAWWWRQRELVRLGAGL